jgi:hypothetical protein
MTCIPASKHTGKRGNVAVHQPLSECHAGGAKFFKSIAQRELLSILSDDGLSLYSEMLIIKVHATLFMHYALRLLLHTHIVGSSTTPAPALLWRPMDHMCNGRPALTNPVGCARRRSAS